MMAPSRPSISLGGMLAKDSGVELVAASYSSAERCGGGALRGVTFGWSVILKDFPSVPA